MRQSRAAGLALLIVMTTSIVSLVDARFLSAENLRDIAVRAAPTAIVACGVMWVVVTGEIDISVGSLMAVLATVMGTLMSRDHWAWSPWIAVPCLLTLGTLVGWVTGSLVTIGRVPSIIVTLGMLTGLRGATNCLMRGENIDDLPLGLTELAKRGWWGLPLGIWTAVVIVAVQAWMIWRTPLGRQMFAVGSSPGSARMAGLSIGRLKRFAFAYTGLLTAVATLVDVPRLPKIEAGIGVEFELLVVTCVVVGGVAIAGGRGTLPGVLLAVWLMTMIRPVLTFLDLGAAGETWTKAIQGGFILLTVVVDSLQSRASAVTACRDGGQ